MIYARNEETGEVGLKRVKKTLGGKAHTIYTIGMGEYGIIQSTNYHRYYVEEKGWVSAIQLQVGDYLCTIEGEHVEITSIEKERQEEGVAVYNFVVEDWESYFVSEVGVYVHNDPCDPKKGKSKTPKNKPNATKHSKYRRNVTNRPTDPIVNDIQKARPKDILIEDNGNIIIRGANGRVHVLSPDAQRHVTTLKRTSSNIESLIRQGRYRQATYSEIDKLLELYKN